MSSGANLKGFDDVLRNIEAQLGEPVVRRKVNKVLKGTVEEFEPTFKRAMAVYADTGKTVGAVVHGNVTGTSSGVPMVKLGFKSPRWTLIHLNEFGYAKNGHPRGFGIMRRFFEGSKPVFKSKVGMKLKQEFL